MYIAMPGAGNWENKEVAWVSRSLGSIEGLRSSVVKSTKALSIAIEADRLALRESAAALAAQTWVKNAAHAKKIHALERNYKLIGGGE